MTVSKRWVVLAALFGATTLLFFLKPVQAPVGRELVRAFMDVKAIQFSCDKFVSIDGEKMRPVDQQWDANIAALNGGERDLSSGDAAGRILAVYQIAEQISYSSEGGEDSLKAECGEQVDRVRKSLGSASPLAMGT